MLNNIGLPGLLLIVAVTLLLFGRGKISSIMGELGSGLTAFKRGLQDPGDPDDQESKTLPGTDISGSSAPSGRKP